MQLAKRRAVLVRDRKQPGGAPLAQQRQGLFHQGQLAGPVPVAAAHPLGQRLDATLEAFEIGEHQLGVHNLGVRHRIGATLDMGDLGVLETA